MEGHGRGCTVQRQHQDAERNLQQGHSRVPEPEPKCAQPKVRSRSPTYLLASGTWPLELQDCPGDHDQWGRSQLWGGRDEDGGRQPWTPLFTTLPETGSLIWLLTWAHKRRASHHGRNHCGCSSCPGLQGLLNLLGRRSPGSEMLAPLPG